MIQTTRQQPADSYDGAQDRTGGHGKKSRIPRKRRNRPPSSADVLPGPQSSPFDASLYINRELSWLEFNQRVLDEARDERHPLLERAKFLSIVSTNLDEFFMIRVAAIKEQILADVVEYSPDGMVPVQQIRAIHQRVERMVGDMSACFWQELHPKLRAAGIHLLRFDEVGQDDRARLSVMFAREIYPVLTPLAFDPGHPFPYISNLSMNLAVVVSTPRGEERFARVKVPGVFPRLIPLEEQTPEGGPARFVWLEDLIADNLGMLFPGMTVKESYAFRVTRNADIEIQEDEAEDLISSIEESIRLRRFGSVVRVGIQKTMPDRIRDILIENLEVTPDDVYHLTPPMGLGHLMSLMKLPRPELKDPPLVPANPMIPGEGEDMFAAIRRRDFLLHHPYDSFAPVVQFITAAARDPNVLAIKQTLYRIGKESPLIPLLMEAAENGKQVAVLVELKARFDEENNIIWAKQLERAGIHVVYGLVGLKTHAKMALVVRREGDRTRRYVHLGTGNYNPVTAKIYTDFSYFTAREDITADATEVFNYLTGYSRRDDYTKLAVAPVTLRKALKQLIEREAAHAREGRRGRMIIKVNSLTDPKMIMALYEASKAGVSIDLIVRGVCCLRPGIPAVSENVRVISIVGRFLEHSRVFYAWNNGSPELYMGSADIMGRNLDRRVELLFPIEDPALQETARQEVLESALRDTMRARMLQPDGTYARVVPADGQELHESQQHALRVRAEGDKPPLAVRAAPPPASPAP
ncbi:MAG: ppk1 [Bacteroidetes bacterium]|nr:ppk1 [Bacteroidota bacterium]